MNVPLIRVAAKGRKTNDAAVAVHVLFARDDGQYPRELWGWYMSVATYHAIPLSQDATPADYAAHGTLISAPSDFEWEAAS